MVPFIDRQDLFEQLPLRSGAERSRPNQQIQLVDRLQRRIEAWPARTDRLRQRASLEVQPRSILVLARDADDPEVLVDSSWPEISVCQRAPAAMSVADMNGSTSLMTDGNQSLSASATARLFSPDQLRNTFMCRPYGDSSVGGRFVDDAQL